MNDRERDDTFPRYTYNGFAVRGDAPEPAAAAPPRQQARRAPLGPMVAVGCALLLVAGLASAGLRTRAVRGVETAPAAPPSAPLAPAMAPAPAEPSYAAAPVPASAWSSSTEAPTADPERDPAVQQIPIAVAAAQTDRAERPAFHCEWRLRISERQVCQDPRLAALDRRLNSAFAAAVRAGAPRAALRAEQDAWVYRRDVVARRSPGMLGDYYRKRIAELQAMAAPPA